MLGCEDTGHSACQNESRHATHGTNCFVCQATVVGTKWCLLPVTRDGTGWWGETCRLSGAPVPSVSAGLESSAAYLELHFNFSDSLCFQWNNAVWWANFTKKKGLSKNVFCPHFSGSLGKISKSRRSRCDICLHNHSTEHWGFKRDLYALPTHSVVTH